MASASLRMANRSVSNIGCRSFSTTQQQNITLKDIRLRLKSVQNIRKITKTMQMVSAAKYAKAERELKPARVYGAGAAAVFEKADIPKEDKPNKLLIAISSDRGLCGGIHSGVSKAIKAHILTLPADVNAKIVICGDKARNILQRTHSNDILFHFTELGRKPPIFEEASFIAENVLDSGFDFDNGEIFYNKFRSVISYSTTPLEIYSFNALNTAETMLQYDDVDADVLRNFHEFSLANLVFFGMKESACSEQSARMSSMDAATKNAGDMIDRLQVKYNRTRQAVITTELSEIISGSVALETKD